MGKVRHYARLCEDTREYSNNQRMYAAEGIYGCFIRWDEHQYLIRFFFLVCCMHIIDMSSMFCMRTNIHNHNSLGIVKSHYVLE